MVESRLNGFSGTTTPTSIRPGGEYGPYDIEKRLANAMASRVLSAGSSDSSGLTVSTVPSDSSLGSIPSRPASAQRSTPTIDGATTPPASMPGDASSQNTPVRNRSRANNRRRPFNVGGLSRASTGLAGPPVPASPAGYFPPPNPANEPSNSLSFHQHGIHFSSPPPFDQRSGFYGQYTVPSQPQSLSLGQPHGPYSYHHPFQSSPLPDGQVSSPPLHFPQHIPPNPPLYQYRRHPSEDGLASPPSFSGRGPGPSRFSHHQGPANMPPPSSDVGPGPQMSSVYMGGPHFQQMGYSSSLPSSPYAYPPQYSSPPQVYPSYAPVPSYQHHPSSPREVEPQSTQGSWYFVPHSPPPQQTPYDYRASYPYQYIGQTHDPHVHVPAAPSVATPQEQIRLAENVISTASPPPPRSAPSSLGGRNSPAASSLQQSTSSRPVVRREWHPRPPAHRSPWVMWVGNVPSDATQEELWTFFSHIPGGDSSKIDTEVESIFLIGRSNCAFINFSREEAVTRAIQVFNGKRLRPNDPQCPMLVCKIRRSADDLKSGVGGQRGIGLHRQWVQEQRASLSRRPQGGSDLEVSDDQSSEGPDSLVDGLGSLSVSTGRRKGTKTSSLSSHASTTSSFLTEYFPTRYFILKSLSEEDLDISVRNGLWATQKHNELLLDQAFRTAKDVYLIFSVNKSGEFYGYAKMAGPIRYGEGSVTWASRSDDGSQASGPETGRRKTISGIRALSPTKLFFTPDGSHVVDASPLQITDLHVGPPSPPVQHHYPTAPGKLGGLTPDGVHPSPALKFSLDHRQNLDRPVPGQVPFELDREAPKRAVRSGPTDHDGWVGGPSNRDGAPNAEDEPHTTDHPGAPGWGDCFKIEWLERRKIPFYRTRHLRNPWNKGREIKISRDGTELEPSVGKQLLEEWPTLISEAA